MNCLICHLSIESGIIFITINWVSICRRGSKSALIYSKFILVFSLGSYEFIKGAISKSSLAWQLLSVLLLILKISPRWLIGIIVELANHRVTQLAIEFPKRNSSWISLNLWGSVSTGFKARIFWRFCEHSLVLLKVLGRLLKLILNPRRFVKGSAWRRCRFRVWILLNLHWWFTSWSICLLPSC